MPEDTEDVLKVIPNEDLPKLLEIYRKHSEKAPHVCSLISTKIRWNGENVNPDYLIFMSPDDSWKTDGTIIVLKKMSVHELFVFTLDPKCRNLYKGLKHTNIIDFSKIRAFEYIHADHHWTVTKIIEDRGLTVDHIDACDGFSISKDVAKEFTIECPSEVYIKKIDKSKAPSWYSKKENSTEEHTNKMMEPYDAFGVFSKEGDNLLAWGLKNPLSQPAMVHTAKEIDGTNYETLVAKVLSKEVAQDGHDPFAAVPVKDIKLQGVFRKLGYCPIGFCYFLGVSPSYPDLVL